MSDLSPLATTADLRSFTGETFDDAAAMIALDSASGFVRDHCGWAITRATQELTLPGTPSRQLWVPTLRLRGVVAATRDGVPLDLTKLRTSTVGIVLSPAPWGDIFTTIDITIDHGHDEVPQTVRAVTLMIAYRLLDNGLALRSLSLAGVSQSMDTPYLRPEEERLLQKFRLPPAVSG